MLKVASSAIFVRSFETRDAEIYFGSTLVYLSFSLYAQGVSRHNYCVKKLERKVQCLHIIRPCRTAKNNNIASLTIHFGAGRTRESYPTSVNLVTFENHFLHLI